MYNSCFYTSNANVFKSIINQYVEFSGEMVIEPSCGTGEFLKYFKFDKCYDIEKKVESEIFQQINFLETNDNNAIYIGNPPFGKNNDLVIKFCNHCCNNNAKYICFILPQIYEKKNIQNKSFNEYYHCLISIPYNAFYVLQNNKQKIKK